MDNSVNETLQKLQDTNIRTGFPSHVLDVLNCGEPIHFSEIFCRLVQVCMVEVGFIPVLDQDDGFSLEQLLQMNMKESVPKFVKDLTVIINKLGSLHNVTFKAIVYEEVVTLSSEDNATENNAHHQETRSGESSRQVKTTGYGLGLGKSSSVLTVETESGDGSSSGIISSEESEQQIMSDTISITALEKTISNNISVCIAHDGYDMFVIASNQDFQKNIQIPISNYIRPTIAQLPTIATANDYLRLVNFSASRFADDVKRKFCYPIMDEIDGLSFEIRSLAWLPPEVIIEVAKRCSPLAVFRLRATCVEIKNALSSNNQQFWKMLLKRDFPQCNIQNLMSDPSEDKYFRKYSEMCSFTMRRPLRRTLGRIFPFYLMSNFRV